MHGIKSNRLPVSTLGRLNKSDVSYSLIPSSGSLGRSAIREYAQQTGMAVGFKPAGGLRTAKQSLDWLAVMKEELGDSWLCAEMLRFGASGLLGDIERQLDHYATGRYSAEYRHPIA